MKKILMFLCTMLLHFVINSVSQYELDFLQNDDELIIKNQLISKKQVLELVFKGLLNPYAKMNKDRLKKLVNNADIVLVEEIMSEESMTTAAVKYYYVVQVKSEDGRIIAIESINAQTSQFLDGSYFDNPFFDVDGSKKTHFAVIMDKNEIIEYIKKYLTFPDDSKLTIRAIYDKNFTEGISIPNRAIYWKYCITIENGMFNSDSLPTGIDTIFIIPYIDGYEEKREKAKPDNGISTLYKHRLFAHSYANNGGSTTESRTLKPENHQNNYIDID